MAAQNTPAQRNGPDRRARPTLRDVAALAGVSVATASQALRGGQVKSSTRQAVREAAKKLRYVPQVGGSMLRTGRSRTVGLWILNRPDMPELTEAYSFFYPIIRGAMDALESAGYGLRFSAVSGPPDDVAEQLATVAASGSLAGFVVIPQWGAYAEYIAGLIDLEAPVVLEASVAGTHAGAPGGGVPYVAVDNVGGVMQLVSHLVELGHRRIGCLAGPGDHLDAELRLAAFYRAAAAHGLRVHDAWVRRVPFTIAGGEVGLRALLEETAAVGLPPPTALLGADDYIAAGAVRFATRTGITVPGTLSIVGFDDVDVARATVPALTTVRLPLRELGRAAAERVLRLIAGKAVEPVELPVELVVRESAAPPSPS